MSNRKFIQVTGWDIELENENPNDPLYIEIYQCSICKKGLPYPKADHPCINGEDDDEDTDEGFEEDWDYYTNFKLFCAEVQDKADIHLVLHCQICESFHFVQPVYSNDNDDDD